MAEFVRVLYANVAPDDLAGDSARISMPRRSASGPSAPSASRARPGAGRQPRPDEHGWISHHTIIEMVNDDMPFLVDSLTAALHRRDLTVHLVIHPICR